MKQEIKRFAMIMDLLRKHPWGRSIKEIAAGLELDQQTVEHDLKVLSGLNVPLGCEPLDQDEENWFVNGNSQMPTLRFTEGETLALLELLGAEHSMLNQSIRIKLQKTILDEETVSIRQILKDRLLLKGPRPFCTSREVAGKIDQIEKAVLQDCSLLVHYRPSRLPVMDIKLDAYGLIYNWVWGFWYLYGRDANGDEQTLRVDRIQWFEEIDHFQYPAGFVLEERFADAWGVDFSDPVVEIRIRFEDDFEVIPRVMRETAHRRNRTVEAIPGGMIYTDQVNGTTEIRPWIRSFGSSATVLAPEELRENMIASAWKVYGLYGGSELEV